MRPIDLLECVLDVKQMVDMEGCLEASHTTGREGGGASTLGTGDRELSLLFTDNHSIETVLTVDVEAGEQSRVGVGAQTDWACELFFHFRESFFGSTGSLSHCQNYWGIVKNFSSISL